jgi:hypothetical protein
LLVSDESNTFVHEVVELELNKVIVFLEVGHFVLLGESFLFLLNGILIIGDELN